MSGNTVPATTEEQDDDQDLENTDGFGSIESGYDGDVGTKDLGTGDDTLPLAQETGTDGSVKRKMDEEAIHDRLADDIYDSNKVVFREFHQNAETACVNACRLLLTQHPDYGPEWFGREVDIDHEEAPDDLTRELPRDLSEIVGAARELGYDPTIEVTVHRDERKVVIEDNGIGMTAREVDKAFNTTGLSGVRDDGATGGMMGMGVLTFKNFTGKGGGMDVRTRTRRPDAPDADKEGIRFYAYLGGVDELDNSAIGDSFYGTRFEMPVQDSVGMSNFRDWVQEYAQGLRIPLLYEEHRDGKVIYDDEYEGETLFEAEDEPPVKIHRPGEFTAVAGPGIDTYGEDDTFLVSMPIERNTRAHFYTMWDVKVQLHNEQGLIVEGPHRGFLADEVDGNLHPDDIKLPEPTGDRDRLQDSDANKQFFEHIGNLVTDEELEVASAFVDKCIDARNPAEVIADNPDRWTVFKRAVRKHGSYGTTDSKADFESFMQHTMGYNLDDDLLEALYRLWREITHAPPACRSPSKKSRRKSKDLGDAIAKREATEVFMGCTIREEYHKVVHNTYDNAMVLAVSSAGRYPSYKEHYGFELLKEVPTEQSDDHDFDVPDSVANSSGTSSTSSNKPDDVESRRLALRTNTEDSKVDLRKRIGELKDIFDGEGGGLRSHSRLVLFPRHKEPNISDNYDMADHAAIASCSKTEYEELADADRVYLPDEFRRLARETEIPTEEGTIEAGNLDDAGELDDTEHLLFIRPEDETQGQTISEWLDEYPELTAYLKRFVRRNKHRVHDDDDITLALVEQETLYQATEAFDNEVYGTRLLGLRLGYHGGPFPAAIRSVTMKGKSFKKYLLHAKTPDWDDDSPVYDTFEETDSSSALREVLLGLHDAGVDPSEVDNDELRNGVAEGF